MSEGAVFNLQELLGMGKPHSIQDHFTLSEMKEELDYSIEYSRKLWEPQAHEKGRDWAEMKEGTDAHIVNVIIDSYSVMMDNMFGRGEKLLQPPTLIAEQIDILRKSYEEVFAKLEYLGTVRCRALGTFDRIRLEYDAKRQELVNRVDQRVRQEHSLAQADAELRSAL